MVFHQIHLTMVVIFNLKWDKNHLGHLFKIQFSEPYA